MVSMDIKKQKSGNRIHTDNFSFCEVKSSQVVDRPVKRMNIYYMIAVIVGMLAAASVADAQVVSHVKGC